MLVENGAEELYAGMQAGGWSARFGELLWLNRRGPLQGNTREPDAMGEIVRRARAAGVPVFLTMNAPTYTPEQLDVVASLCRYACEELGARAVIVADPSLMLALAERRVPFFVSSLGSSFNSETLRFYADLGAERVILPRQVSLAEIAQLRRRAPEVPVEAFVYNDPCVFDEGMCQTSHGAPGGAFCHLPFDTRVTTFDGAPVDASTPGRALARFREHLAEWQAYVKAAERDATQFSPTGAPLGACGLCAITTLVELGVTALKIVGREAAPLRKLRSVQIVARLVREARAGLEHRAAARLARELRGDRARCEQGYSCYYRDVPRD
jgi:putative protease